MLAYHDITELVMASRIKDEFVASVSHELRTPLTSIIGYVDVILDDTEDLPGRRARLPRTVQRNARRLHRLVDDLLSTALQSVATVLDIERVSVTELLRALGRRGAQGRRGRGPRRSSSTPPAGGDELDIDGDSERLAQVFDNLFSNASSTPRRRPRRGRPAARRRRGRGPGPRHRPRHRGGRARARSSTSSSAARRAHRRHPRRRAGAGDHQDDRGRPRRQRSR